MDASAVPRAALPDSQPIAGPHAPGWHIPCVPAAAAERDAAPSRDPAPSEHREEDEGMP
jgi:hypothetical protein